VQQTAMKAWDEGKDFRELLRQDAGVGKLLSKKELEALFDYGYYLRYMDEIFERAGMARAAPRR